MKENYGENKILKKTIIDSIRYFPSIIIPSGLGFLSIIIYARILSINNFGMYSLIITTINILSSILVQWILQSIQRYRPIYIKDNLVKYFNKNLVLLTFFTFLLFTLVYLFVWPLITIYSQKYSEYLFIILILILSQGAYTICITILKSDMKIAVFRANQIIYSIVKLLIPLILFYFLERNILMILWGTFYANIFGMILIAKKSEIVNFKINDLKEIQIEEIQIFSKKFMRYGFPMIGFFLGVSVLNLTDRYMLEYFSDIKSVGIYSAFVTLTTAIVNFYASPLMTASHPIIMNSSVDQIFIKEKLEGNIGKFTLVFLLLSFPMLIIGLVLYKEISFVFFGEKYIDGSILLPLMLLGLIIWNTGMYGHKIYEVSNETSKLLRYVIYCAVLNIILNICLIPKYDYLGAAISTNISFFVYPFLIYISLRRKAIKWRVPIVSLLVIIFLNLISILPVIFIEVNLFSNEITSYKYSIFKIMFVSIMFLILYIASLLFVKKKQYLKL